MQAPELVRKQLLTWICVERIESGSNDLKIEDYEGNSEIRHVKSQNLQDEIMLKPASVGLSITSCKFQQFLNSRAA